MPLRGVDLVERVVRVAAEGDVVEDEELGLRTEERLVRDAAGLEVRLGALGDGTRVAIVGLAVTRLKIKAGDRKLQSCCPVGDGHPMTAPAVCRPAFFKNAHVVASG